MSDLAEWLEANGYIAGTELDDGTVIAETITVTGGGQIIRGTRNTVNDRWSYPTIGHASAAYIRWGVTGFVDEPDGWVRHVPSNRRRRPDGVEYIAP